MKFIPEPPNTFQGNQVIINSDRLVFNAKTDHILISAEKSIFLGSNSSINFTTPHEKMFLNIKSASLCTFDTNGHVAST